MLDSDSFQRLYRTHEDDVLRRFMAHLRAPELAADLTAETFAAAILSERDASRESEGEWLARTAEGLLVRAYSDGAVPSEARDRAGMPRVALDDRGLDRVWRLRAGERDAVPRPRPSGAIALATRPTGTASPVTLPALEAALLDAVKGQLRRRRRRGHGKRALRVAITVASVWVFFVPGVLPHLRHRPTVVASYGAWLPFAQRGVEGYVPSTWFLAGSLREPPETLAGEPALATMTTFDPQPQGDRGCGALAELGDGDALAAVFKRRVPVAVGTQAHGCAPQARIERHGNVLLVFGPAAPRATRRLAREIPGRITVH